MGHEKVTPKKLGEQRGDRLRFSVIIPTFNREKYVVRALDSILAQSGEQPEILVIDDGSTDRTAEVLRPYQDQIRYFHTKNQGVSAARNLGIEKASHEWIGFLDSDDEYLPNYMNTQRNNILANPECYMHMMNSFQVDLQGRKVNTFQDNPSPIPASHEVFKPSDPFWFVLKNHLYYLQPTVMRKSALIAAGMFNREISIAEDLDLVARVARQGPIALYNPPMVAIYRREENKQNLTEQIFSHGIRSQDVLGGIYRNLLAMPDLTERQEKLLRSLYAANRRAVGNLYLRKGMRERTIASYYQGWRVDHSWRSALRMLLAFLPKRIVLKTIRKEWNVNP
ncbi:MAG: glycosyltransferase [Desulfobulbaceae bacterium]|nr:glycosyltransferase [Desulfobulbaceae bacterium]